MYLVLNSQTTALQQCNFCCISNGNKIFVFSKKSRQNVQLAQPSIRLVSGIIQQEL